VDEAPPFEYQDEDSLGPVFNRRQSYQTKSRKFLSSVPEAKHAISTKENKSIYGEIFKRLKLLGCNPIEILGDGSTAITGAASDVFKEAKRRMCWAHAFRNMEKQLPASIAQAVLDDIRRNRTDLRYHNRLELINLFVVEIIGLIFA